MRYNVKSNLTWKNENGAEDRHSSPCSFPSYTLEQSAFLCTLQGLPSPSECLLARGEEFFRSLVCFQGLYGVDILRKLRFPTQQNLLLLHVFQHLNKITRKEKATKRLPMMKALASSRAILPFVAFSVSHCCVKLKGGGLFQVSKIMGLPACLPSVFGSLPQNGDDTRTIF